MHPQFKQKLTVPQTPPVVTSKVTHPHAPHKHAFSSYPPVITPQIAHPHALCISTPPLIFTYRRVQGYAPTCTTQTFFLFISTSLNAPNCAPTRTLHLTPRLIFTCRRVQGYAPTCTTQTHFLFISTSLNAPNCAPTRTLHFNAPLNLHLSTC